MIRWFMPSDLVESPRDSLVRATVADSLTVVHGLQAMATPDVCQMDVTMPQVKAMMTVSMRGQATVGEIARITGVGLPASSTTVDKLVNMGWLLRDEDPSDRRRVIVRLTNEGTAIVERVLRVRRDLLSSWVTRLDDDELTSLQQGMAALKRVAEGEVRFSYSDGPSVSDVPSAGTATRGRRPQPVLILEREETIHGQPSK